MKKLKRVTSAARRSPRSSGAQTEPRSVKSASTPEHIKQPCQHLTGYWINKAWKNFRCYECQYQFHIGDNLPADHPTKGIEVWEG